VNNSEEKAEVLKELNLKEDTPVENQKVNSE